MATPTFATGIELMKEPHINLLQVGLIVGPTPVDGQAYDFNQMQEAGYADYHRSGPDDWEDPVCDHEKCVTRRSKPIEFRCTGASPGNIIVGYFVKLWVDTGDVLLQIAKIAPPRRMEADGDNFTLEVNVAVFDESILA